MAQVHSININFHTGVSGGRGGGPFYGGRGGDGGDDDNGDGDDGERRRRLLGGHGADHRADPKAPRSITNGEDEEKKRKRPRLTKNDKLYGRTTSSRRRKRSRKSGDYDSPQYRGAVTSPTYTPTVSSVSSAARQGCGTEVEDNGNDTEDLAEVESPFIELENLRSEVDRLKREGEDAARGLRNQLEALRTERDKALQGKGELQTQLTVAERSAADLARNVREAWERLMEFIQEHLTAFDGTVFTPTNPAYGDLDDGRAVWERVQVNPADPYSAWRTVRMKDRLNGSKIPPALEFASSKYTAREANGYCVTRLHLDHQDKLHPEHRFARPQQLIRDPVSRKLVPLETLTPMPIIDRMGEHALRLANQMIADFPTVFNNADRRRIEDLLNERDVFRRSGNLVDTFPEAVRAGMNPTVEPDILEDWRDSFTQLVDFGRLANDHATFRTGLNPKHMLEYQRINENLYRSFTLALDRLHVPIPVDNTFVLQGTLADYARVSANPNGTGVAAASVRDFVERNQLLNRPLPPPPPPPVPAPPIVVSDDDDDEDRVLSTHPLNEGDP